LADILRGLDRKKPVLSPSSVEKDLRDAALRVLDLADGLADSLRGPLGGPETPADTD